MTRFPSADEAAAALSAVQERQRQIVDQAQLPTWYWSAIGALMVAFAATVDSYRNHPVVIGVSVAIFVAAVLSLTGWAIRRVARAQVSGHILGARGVLAILAFIGAVIGISLAAAFAFQARGLTHPATAGVTVGAVLLALGGPRLMSYLRRQMLVRARTMP